MRTNRETKIEKGGQSRVTSITQMQTRYIPVLGVRGLYHRVKVEHHNLPNDPRLSI